MKWQGRELVIATRNEGKAREFAEMFAPLGVTVRSLRDYPDLPDVEETGTTFRENAEIKATTIARLLGVPALADDSGLCVDALGGAPGVYSARYSGEGATDARNNAKLLHALQQLGPNAAAHEAAAGSGASASPRAAADELARPALAAGRPALLSRAQFVCALAFHDPAARTTRFAEGACAGWIAAEPRGDRGFGYDPLFYMPEYGRTMAELTDEEKNRVSHRALALRRMLEQLQSDDASPVN